MAESLDIRTERILFWCDSTAVLGWLRASPEKHSVYVHNRVVKVTDCVPSSQWRYIATDVNPADAASRGVFPEELTFKKLWWESPQWLTNPPAEWPVRLDIGDPPAEEQANLPALVLHVQPTDEPPELLLFSSFYRLTRFWAYAKRWISAVRAKQSPNSFLTNRELQAAEQSLIITSQRKFYPQEYYRLQSGQHVSPKSPLSKLSPYLDKQGVIRVGGRLHNANLAEATKHPMILHQKSRIVLLLMNDLHQRHFHASARVMLAIVAVVKYYHIFKNFLLHVAMYVYMLFVLFHICISFAHTKLFGRHILFCITQVQ